MMEFFQAQMDYIYFFYGLSFFFLGIVAFLMKQQYKLGPTWFLLGLFGILHGFNEWVELLRMIFGNLGVWFTILRLFLLTSSFFFLFEFVRNNNNNNNNYKIGKWIYILISIILLLSWYFYGEIGFELFVRYILGLTGALGAGFVFWYYNFLSKKHFSSFCMGAIAFWFYALSILINSSGHILGIKFTDQAVFFETFGFPIQMVRGVLMTIILLSVWLNYQVLIYKDLTPQQTIKKNRLNRYFFSCLFVVFVFGWFFTNGLDLYIRKKIHRDGHGFSLALSANTERALQNGEDLSLVLSGSTSAIKVLQEPTPETVAAANLAVDRFTVTADIDIAYILNKDGNTVASSNRNEFDSLLGRNYSFRSYFKEAINGKSSTLFAQGVTTKKPGYYSSQPVFDDNKNILGVAVIKTNLSFFEKNLSNFGKILLVSPDGVVFLASDSKFVSKSIYPISQDERRKLVKSKLYDVISFEPIFNKKYIDGDSVALDGEAYILDIIQVNGIGWNIYILNSAQEIAYYRLFIIVLTLIFNFVVISFFIIIQYVKRDAALSYFASILHFTRESIVGKDLSDKVISWNKGAEIMYGYNENEIIGKNISILIPLDVYKKNKLVEDQIISGKNINHFETIHKRKNGELINVDMTISPVKNDEGEIVGTSTISRDITREKKIEEDLATRMVELEKFKLASDSSSDTIVITDKDGRILYQNKAAEIISGFSENEIHKNYIGKLWGGHMEKSFYQKMWHTIKNEKKPFIGELKNRRKNGEEYVVLARFYPLLDKSNNVNFFVGVETDISKIKEMERIKSEFVSIASHQLRTPLTGIKWFSELLIKDKAGVLSVEQKDYVKQIYDSNERMIRLVDDLLDVSHIDESGKFKIILISEDFSTIIKEVVKQQKIQAKVKNIKIALSADCLDKMILKVDRSKLEQAMQNILSNAIKYSPNGSTISVECKKDKDLYVCSFQDKGIGIPSYQQHRVFEKFFRADNVITVGSGTGLGLYIARYIIEGHGGKMWFDSKENKGTTFYFSIPIK